MRRILAVLDRGRISISWGAFWSPVGWLPWVSIDANREGVFAIKLGVIVGLLGCLVVLLLDGYRF